MRALPLHNNEGNKGYMQNSIAKQWIKVRQILWRYCLQRVVPLVMDAFRFLSFLLLLFDNATVFQPPDKLIHIPLNDIRIATVIVCYLNDHLLKFFSFLKKAKNFWTRLVCYKYFLPQCLNTTAPNFSCRTLTCFSNFMFPPMV